MASIEGVSNKLKTRRSLPAALLIPSSKLTELYGVVKELPPPPTTGGYALGPRTAIVRIFFWSKGKEWRSFFKSTIPLRASSSAISRPIWLYSGMLLSICGRSRKPNSIAVRRIRLTFSSIVANFTSPRCSAGKSVFEFMYAADGISRSKPLFAAPIPS